MEEEHSKGMVLFRMLEMTRSKVRMREDGRTCVFMYFGSKNCTELVKQVDWV